MERLLKLSVRLLPSLVVKICLGNSFLSFNAINLGYYLADLVSYTEVVIFSTQHWRQVLIGCKTNVTYFSKFNTKGNY